MKSSADMPCCAPMQKKVKQSSNTMPNQGSNTPTQGKGGGHGGEFTTKHTPPSGPVQKEIT